MPLAIGAQLGPYEVMAAIGAGGMGEVYRARDGRLGRDVALKVLPEVFARRTDRLARFEREARAAGALSHPNILSVYDVGSHDGRPYVVFELLEGGTLRTRLRGAALTIRKSLEVAAQAAHGLDAAHAKGIVHRDLKPENLFLTTDGVVKIVDFGLAKLEDEPALPASDEDTPSAWPWRTSTGVVLGTAAYMSPEQARGDAVDGRSDIFALGAVLYEMLAGAAAFERKTRPETMVAVLSEDPPDLARKRPGVPPAVAALVRRCLEKDPADRFQSARDLAFALETLAPGADAQPSGSARRLRLRGRPRATLLAATGLIVAAAAVGWWLGMRGLLDPTRDLGVPYQITSDPGKEVDPALSPDGSLVAYASDRSGNDEIWISDVHGGAAVQLTEDPAIDKSPAWLPDGSALLFESDRGGSSGIWKVPRLGGSAVLVVADARSPAVSPDGKWLAFARGQPDAARIVLAPLSDASSGRPLTGDGDGLFGHNHPAWSPDGSRLCYADYTDLWLVSVSGGPAWRLTSAHAHDDSPVWSANGREIFFSSRREGTLALWVVRASGGTPKRLTLGTGPENEPSFSGDGRRLAFSTSVQTGNVAIVDLRSRQLQRTRGVRDETEPAISPDKRMVVFPANSEGVYDLWAQPLDEGRPVGAMRRLTDSPGDKSCPVFSPDGRWIAFTQILDGQRDIFAIPASGGPARRLTESPAQDMYPAFSADGSRLAFASDRAGHLSIWALKVADGSPVGEATRLTFGSQADFMPWWSPDGRSLAFGRLEGQTVGIWLTSADAPQPPRRLATAPNALMLRWIDGGLFAAARWGSEGVSLRRLDLRTGGAIPLDPPLALASRPFDISRDASLVAFDDRPTRGDIWVLEGGPASRR
jgi:eukaryotic-like serine/threonine-protein kinase